MRKKILLSFVGIVWFLFFFSFNANAIVNANISKDISYKEIVDGGGYIDVDFETLNIGVSVEISEEIVPYLKEAGISVVDEIEKNGWWIFSSEIHHYSYSSKEYKYRINSIRTLDNSIESLIYMIKKLESYAERFKLNNTTSFSSRDLTLGYIRCINKNYSDSSSYFPSGVMQYAFKYLCNSYCEEFISFVNQIEGEKFPGTKTNITLGNYFASFINNSEVNDLYSYSIKDSLGNTYTEKIRNVCDTNSHINLIDPISGKNIDLIHFMCVIDGCDDDIDVLGGHMISWAGDLQTELTDIACNKINDINDFKHDVLDREKFFNWADFLADIDGYNISLGYLNKHDNSLSNSLAAYYTISDNTFRYKSFIRLVGRTNSENGILGFNDYVTKSMLVDNAYKNEKCTNSLYTIFLSRNPNTNENINIPNLYLRKKMAFSFVDFICQSAGYSTWGDACGGEATLRYNLMGISDNIW
ncbi:MAG: hypothetical protein K2N64_03325 [Anaeroplasmataceae bacterium]|nr:hypothetical protein [Anaeroplasmataceae bacterium]